MRKQMKTNEEFHIKKTNKTHGQFNCSGVQIRIDKTLWFSPKQMERCQKDRERKNTRLTSTSDELIEQLICCWNVITSIYLGECWERNLTPNQRYQIHHAARQFSTYFESILRIYLKETALLQNKPEQIQWISIEQ